MKQLETHFEKMSKILKIHYLQEISILTFYILKQKKDHNTF